MLLLGAAMLAVSHGFQLRVPAVLQPKALRAPGARTTTSKPVSTSSTTETPSALARKDSRDEGQFDWAKHVSRLFVRPSGTQANNKKHNLHDARSRLTHTHA